MLNRLAMVLLFTLAGQAFGQTMVDLRTQSKSVDFSSKPSTTPAVVGTILPASCVTGQLFFDSATSPGANLFGCTATNTWTLMSSSGSGSGSSGSGSSGASMASQLGDLATTLANGTLTIGAGCSSATPCNVRIGNTTYSFKFPGTVSISGSNSGLVFLYIDGGGNLTAGSVATLTCSGCTYAPGVTAFPSNSIPLYTWSSTGGAFDATGGTDFRAMISTKNLLGGPGIIVSENAGTSTVAVDPSLVSLHVITPPSSSSAACSAGQFSYNTTYYYVCVATNTWMRLPLQSF
ncbi:MAG TPA: hypothetical protein VHZ07_00305 [Bryobacteraceae bacterium]|jgi:hypothetical protein|nr:hypothetical protein [Bryobacteraceae bacterium]